MTRCILTVTILLVASVAVADVYRWVDEKGTVNFTEDPGKIPAKFRKKATVVHEGGSAPAEVIETGTEPESKGKKTSPDRSSDSTASQKQEKKKVTYGGKDEDSWKAEYAQARGDVANCEKEIADRKAKLANPVNMNRSDYLGIQAEIKRLEDRLTTLKGKLSAIDERAQKAGVPQEWRR
jgi:hypothetical protein